MYDNLLQQLQATNTAGGRGPVIGPEAGVPGRAEVLGSRLEWARAGQRLWRWGGPEGRLCWLRVWALGPTEPWLGWVRIFALLLPGLNGG